MEEEALTETNRAVIAPDALDLLVDALRARGYRVLGPTVRDGAIIYDDIESAGELPIGWTDRQNGGSYRLERRADEARFGFEAAVQFRAPSLLPLRRCLPSEPRGRTFVTRRSPPLPSRDAARRVARRRGRLRYRGLRGFLRGALQCRSFPQPLSATARMARRVRNRSIRLDTDARRRR